MSPLDVLCLILVGGLAIYLFVALLKPEEFQ